MRLGMLINQNILRALSVTIIFNSLTFVNYPKMLTVGNWQSLIGPYACLTFIFFRLEKALKNVIP